MRPSVGWLLLVAMALNVAGCGGGGGHGGSSTPSTDCASSDPSRWQMLPYASKDADTDGHFTNASGEICSGATLPAGFAAQQIPASSQDCDDADKSRWQMLAYSSADADGDSFWVNASGTVCSGETLPSSYSANAIDTAAPDCDDSDAARWRLTAVYADHDGDGVGSGSYSIKCIGSGPGAGNSLLGYDPNDDANDPAATATTDFDLPPTILVTPDQ